MKKVTLLISLVVTLSLAFTPVKAFAISQGWHIATVGSAGPIFGKIVITVSATDDSFTNQWLELNPEMQNALLATALTAQSNRQSVRIWVMDDPHNLAGLTVQTCYSILLVAE